MARHQRDTANSYHILLRKPDRDPTPEEQGKDPAAVALGKKGGKARADSMTAKKRSEIAKKAAERRWKK